MFQGLTLLCPPVPAVHTDWWEEGVEWGGGQNAAYFRSDFNIRHTKVQIQNLQLPTLVVSYYLEVLFLGVKYKTVTKLSIGEDVSSRMVFRASNSGTKGLHNSKNF